ncbi:MAG TPA: BTAD domain-containing putative transcriptional regulator, partial [Gemmatimonadaceae bacterium]|nr:BTAD domain-containing putative transcriptional regulator [Gemmatimonadaceae bacterium]
MDNSHPLSAPPHGDDHHPPITFHVLGTLELSRTGVGELRALLVQPKRLALFAYLVLANPSRLQRRDSLLPLFWPEATEEQARRSLRQALHFLRQAVGTDVLSSRGDDEIGVNLGAVWCDARRFEAALDGGRLEEAVDLYRGHLLEGFHVSGVAPELEQWLEGERSRLRTRAAGAVLSLAQAAERSGNARLAIQRVR